MVSLFAITISGIAQEEWKPERPITIIIPFAPGGGHDTLTRSITPVAEKYLGVPLIPVNVAGGSSKVQLLKM